MGISGMKLDLSTDAQKKPASFHSTGSVWTLHRIYWRRPLHRDTCAVWVGS
jgi:hypothetical protein